MALDVFLNLLFLLNASPCVIGESNEDITNITESLNLDCQPGWVQMFELTYQL